MFSFFKKWVAQIKDGPVDWDQLEATLIQSDLGVDLSIRILDRLQKQPLSAATVQQAASDEIFSLWSEPVRELTLLPAKMTVWLVVGVNGTGKTTTIAKLAHRYHRLGRKVHVVAADTFRAAALNQLQIWADRVGVSISLGKEGGDPSAAAYEGIEAARGVGSDLVIIDTAGRLHNKENLMRELQKMKRVIAKHDPSFPHETLLVLDGTSGTNTLAQAKEFHQAVGVSGIIMTKLDSSAKGGTIAALKAELGLETLLVGAGEQVEDLYRFDPQEYVEVFFGEEKKFEPTLQPTSESGAFPNPFIDASERQKLQKIQEEVNSTQGTEQESEEGSIATAVAEEDASQTHSKPQSVDQADKGPTPTGLKAKLLGFFGLKKS